MEVAILRELGCSIYELIGIDGENPVLAPATDLPTIVI